MSKMIFASLILNVVVLIPVCSGLVTDANWTQDAYGASSPARGILLSIYGTIILASVFLLFNGDPKFVTALLVIQIVYKLTTPLTVGTVNNPVVVSNLIIAAFHLLTVYTIQGGASPAAPPN